MGKKGIRCSNCGTVVPRVCANCWHCPKCCNCSQKGKRWLNGKIGGESRR